MQTFMDPWMVRVNLLRGDAVAGIFITVVNIIGGILIGYFQRDMTMSDSLQTYTILSIGDGLVSQIPASLYLIAAGILVTRSSEEPTLVSLLASN